VFDSIVTCQISLKRANISSALGFSPTVITRDFFYRCFARRKKISGSKSETSAGISAETSENPLTTCAVIDFNYSAVFNACLPRLRREKKKPFCALLFAISIMNVAEMVFSPSTRSSSRKPYKAARKFQTKMKAKRLAPAESNFNYINH
jgi:hypothetical protein